MARPIKPLLIATQEESQGGLDFSKVFFSLAKEMERFLPSAKPSTIYLSIQILIRQSE